VRMMDSKGNVVFCFVCGQAIEAPANYEPKRGDMVLCKGCFTEHPSPSPSPQCYESKLLFKWDDLIATAEAALERERATLTPEIERIHSLMGRNETSIGLVLLEIIAAAKDQNETKLDPALRSLAEEIPHLSREIRQAGFRKS